MDSLFWLTDAQMVRLQTYLAKSHGKLRVDDWRVLRGIMFINRNGWSLFGAARDYGQPKVLCSGCSDWAYSQGS